MTRQIKAVSLISGGLDSLLATKVVMEQGVHVEGINFFTGFCVEGHTHAIRKKDRARPKRNNALWVAEQLGIKLHIIDVIEDYKDVLINPKHGYGANMNPCRDCKTFMVHKALEWIDRHEFDPGAWSDRADRGDETGVHGRRVPPQRLRYNAGHLQRSWRLWYNQQWHHCQYHK